MEEYRDLIKIVNGEKVVISHMYPSGREEEVRDVDYGDDLPPYKKLDYVRLVTPLINGAYYIMGTIYHINGYGKGEIIERRYLPDKDYDELRLWILNGAYRRITKVLPQLNLVPVIKREADISKLSFLDGAETVMEERPWWQ